MTRYDAPLEQTVQTLKHGDQSLSTYLEEIRDRVETTDPDVQSLVDDPEWDRLAEEAAALEERAETEELPLYGALVAPKDIINVDGLPTKAGSSLPPEAFAGPESAAVTALREAGALVLAKAHTTEMAFAKPGPTCNPYNLAHTPGGSSSGSAAAVGAGLCQLALGTQTTGSSLRPAAFCGTVGLKATHGRISAEGVMERSASLDHVGVFTQDVPGMALAASVLCSGWDPEGTVDDVPILGVPTGSYLEEIRPEGKMAFEKHCEALEDAGYEIQRVDLFEDIERTYELHRAQNAMETALSHHERYEEYGELYSEVIGSFVRRGRSETVEMLATVRADQDRLLEHVESVMEDEGIDLWICPPALGTAPEGIDDTGSAFMNAPWTKTGMPAMSVPGGLVDGLPVGLQVIAPYGEDEQLLEWVGEIAPVVADVIDS